MASFVLACSNESTVLFLLDRARNVGQDNIKRQVEFIISVASTIPFTNIAVISYATDAEIVIRPGQSSNFSDFAETLRNASYSMGHMKNLGEALEKAQEITEIYNHGSTPALVVAMILGKSDDDHSDHAAKLKERGITIVAMTLDNSSSLPQLILLTSNPLNDHWLETNVASLKHFISDTRNTICQGIVRPEFDNQRNLFSRKGFFFVVFVLFCFINFCFLSVLYKTKQKNLMAFPYRAFTRYGEGGAKIKERKKSLSSSSLPLSSPLFA